MKETCNKKRFYSINNQVLYFSKYCLRALFFVLPFVFSLNQAFAKNIDTPSPLVLNCGLPSAWEFVRAGLEKLSYSIKDESKAEGRITTDVVDSSSGINVKSELQKVGKIVSDYATNYKKGEYSIEATIQFLNEQSVMVIVDARIRALKRAIDGKEEWVNIESNGSLEKRLLNEISYVATGTRPYGDNIPFWKKSREIEIKK